jgi:hypothetical protein
MLAATLEQRHLANNSKQGEVGCQPSPGIPAFELKGVWGSIDVATKCKITDAAGAGATQVVRPV